MDEAFLARIFEQVDVGALVPYLGNPADDELPLFRQASWTHSSSSSTFATTLETTFELLEHMPEGATVVSESGIGQREDDERLEEAGVDAILVGESLMREEDIGAKVRELLGQ